MPERSYGRSGSVGPGLRIRRASVHQNSKCVSGGGGGENGAGPRVGYRDGTGTERDLAGGARVGRDGAGDLERRGAAGGGREREAARRASVGGGVSDRGWRVGSDPRDVCARGDAAREHASERRFARWGASGGRGISSGCEAT